MCVVAGRAMLASWTTTADWSRDDTRGSHYIATRAAEGVAFYTVALGALTVWAQYWGFRKERSRKT
jgi:hypothetical protein